MALEGRSYWSDEGEAVLDYWKEEGQLGDGLNLGLEVFLAKNGHLAVVKGPLELHLHVVPGSVLAVHLL